MITSHLSELKDYYYSFNQQLIWVLNWFLIAAEDFCAVCCIKQPHPSFFLYLFINSSGFSIQSESNFQQVSHKIWSIGSKLCTCISTRNAISFFGVHIDVCYPVSENQMISSLLQPQVAFENAVYLALSSCLRSLQWSFQEEN